MGPIFYQYDEHSPVMHDLSKKWGHIISEVAPQPTDFLVHKKRYDGFFETNLDLLLRELGVDTVVVTGVHTDVCVQHTATGAFFRGYKVAVVPECCSSPEHARHEDGLCYMRQWNAVDIVSLDEWVRHIEELPQGHFPVR